jgi:predicted nucleic acid-binding protein
MKRIFLDTNILLDVLLEREPFSQPAQVIWSLSEKNEIHAAISAVSLSNIFFIIKKLSSSENGYKSLNALVEIFDVIDIDWRLVQKSIESRFPDFEDALQYHSALRYRAQAIISRDPAGFMDSKIPLMDCAQYLAGLT